MRPFDSVTLNTDLPASSVLLIPVDTQGAIVEVFANGAAFLVECFDADGNTLDIVEARADQLTLQMADIYPNEAIALLVDLPAEGLQRGQVGIVENRTGLNTYLVVFNTDFDSTERRLLVSGGDMIVLLGQLDAQPRKTA